VSERGVPDGSAAALPAPAEAAPVVATTTAPRHQVLAFAVMVGVLVAAPFFVYPVFLMKAPLLRALRLRLQPAHRLRRAAVLRARRLPGLGGYASAHAAKVWGFPPEGAIVFGTVVAALLGGAIGALTIRSRGIYFANITLAFAQMIFFFAVQARFTGGEDGIQAVPRGTLLGVLDLRQTQTMYFTVLAIFLLGFLVVYRAIHSPFGQVLKAIRENEPRAVSLGYRAEHYKLIAFALSATLSGLAGATKAIVFQLASLTDVHWTMSGEVVLMTLLGGLGTIFGPVVGAFIVIGLENYLAQLGAWVTIVQGAIFVVCVLTFRRGVVGELGRLIRKPL
jgi:branched-chain amino acid transport system permease protein